MVDTMDRRKIYILGVAETRWKGQGTNELSLLNTNGCSLYSMGKKKG